jgi:hypothetical protein
MTRPSFGPWAHPPRRPTRSAHVVVWLAAMVAATILALVVWALT